MHQEVHPFLVNLPVVGYYVYGWNGSANFDFNSLHLNNGDNGATHRDLRSLLID